MTKLEAALDAARRGFAVFPLVPNAKTPALKNWQNLATTDTTQLEAWWAQWPEANIGIVTTPYLVVDIDPWKGGDATAELLALTEDFPKTLCSRSGRGGSHMIYALPEHVVVRGGADKLGKGIDIKSWGGLIAAPGSAIKEGTYAWLNDRPMAIAPQWLIDRCKAAKPKKDNAGKRLVDEDGEAIDRAFEWLASRSPSAEKGNRGYTAYQVACRLYEVGVSRSTCVELLGEWSETRCDPPMDAADVAHAAQSAENNMQNAIGSKHSMAPGFEAVEIGPLSVIPSTERPREKFFIWRADEAAARALSAPRKSLIEGVLQCEGEAVMVGAPGGGKTFLALDMSYHVAKGLSWAGRDVTQGSVVYIATEAQEGINARVAALERHYGALGDTPLYVIPCPADLAHGTADTYALVDLIQKKCGDTVALVVIDTLARAISGGDDSNAKDMGAVIMAAGFIRYTLHTATLLIHHPGKDETKGARGSSHLLGAVDTEMVLKRGELRVTKQRDMVLEAPIRFKLEPVRIGLDHKGREVRSCWVRTLPPNEKGSFDIPLTGIEREVIVAIDAELKHDKNQIIDREFVVKALGNSESNASHEKSTVRGYLSALSAKGWLSKVIDGQYVRERLKALESVGNTHSEGVGV